MSDFTINIPKCKNLSSQINTVGKSVLSSQKQIEKVLNKLNSGGFHYVDTQLKNISQSLLLSKKQFDALSNVIQSSAAVYERTEKEITGNDLSVERVSKAESLDVLGFGSLEEFMQYLAMVGFSPALAFLYWLFKQFTKRERTNPYELNSVLYDDAGSYGGDQGHMKSDFINDPVRREELLEELREYYPGMSDEDAYKYLSGLNAVGCGYVALVNTIFMQYEGNPAKFEKTFGFPMYKDGDLNYDRLLLDLYATTDKSNINIGKNGLPEGTTEKTRNQIINNYLNSKGVHVTTDYHADVNANNYREIVEKGGKVILSYHNDNMYDVNGNPHYIDGGHAIVVTGVTEDGNLIVSSWGEEFTVNPSEFDGNDYFSVLYFQ